MNKNIIEKIFNDLAPIIASDLQISLQEAESMIRETQFFKVLSEECFIDHEYDIIQLCQILRKELIRSRKYTVNEDGEINDFNDFARVMIHEIVYNSSLTIGCKLSLAQVSFIVENIPNFTVDEKDVQIIKKLRDKYLEKIQ